MSNESNRRFHPGQEITIENVQYRVVAGVKRRNGAVDDLRLEWKVAGAWQPIHMVQTFFQTDFFCDNEEVLYPRSKGFRGGYFLLEKLSGAMIRGWQAAEAELKEQKAARRRNEAC